MNFSRTGQPKMVEIKAFAVSICGALAVILSTHLSAETWDVEDAGQPYKDVEFTLSEGTWMSVDVSPDGKTLVFDLLGDLYIMPASGGAAQLLLGGAAIDRTPSFSPDGLEILYLSDRSGQDNAWAIKPDGSGVRQITHETANMLANPAWSADGQYIAMASVVAEFGESYQSAIKLYLQTGGSGITLVEVPENLRDVQEADFSGDGEYVYYTQRLTDTGIYVDANHMNYAVMRRSLASGETEQVVGGFGGALSPQVSPDSKKLAFVRRVKDKTVLFVSDLKSGQQTPVYADLARDQQADFYQQGVYYPAFDWFPDGKSIAIWGKGKLYRVNVANGEASEIPFQVNSKHRITSTPRFADPLAPAEMEVLTARQLALSPDGDELVFHALGHLWKKTLPNGQPTRLTNAAAFEFEASYSSSGKNIVYIEWDDEGGSSLMLADSRGQKPKTITSSTGVIRQPALSPDGKTLVFVIDEPNKYMGGYRSKSGLYVVSSSGGTPRLIGARAIAPMYSADGKRIYFSREEGGNTTLSSVNLDGYEPRDHALATGADRYELRLSPDGRWLTFKEHQQYYLMPYVETGNVFDVSASSKSVPVAQLTETSGNSLAWSADSRLIYWNLGSDLYTAKANQSFLLSGEIPTPLTTLDLTVPGDRPEGIVAFIGGRVITMNEDEVIEQGTVVVKGNQIIAVGPVGEVEIPQQAYVVDTTGKTVMPGLVDMHGHIDCCYYDGLMPQKHPSQYAAAAYGITTNYDPYTSEISAYTATEMQKAGLLVAPRFISTGRVIYGRANKGDHAYVPLLTYADAQNTMDRKRALGGRIIKSYKQPSRRARQQLVKAGREAGVMVDAEGESQFYVDLSIILDGHMALEHVFPVATLYNDIVQLMAHSDVANTPTINVTFGEIMGENFLYQTTRAWEDPKVIAYVQEVNSGYGAINVPYSAPLHVV
jgi:Tol biopolymer transport system component